MRGGAAEPAPGCPAFKTDSVWRRPDGDPATSTTVCPGAHVNERADGPYTCVWWDPNALDLGVEPEIGIRRESLIIKDVPDQVVADGLRDYARWRDRREAAIADGSRPSRVGAHRDGVGGHRRHAGEGLTRLGDRRSRCLSSAGCSTMRVRRRAAARRRRKPDLHPTRPRRSPWSTRADPSGRAGRDSASWCMPCSPPFRSTQTARPLTRSRRFTAGFCPRRQTS